MIPVPVEFTVKTITRLEKMAPERVKAFRDELLWLTASPMFKSELEDSFRLVKNLPGWSRTYSNEALEVFSVMQLLPKYGLFTPWLKTIVGAEELLKERLAFYDKLSEKVYIPANEIVPLGLLQLFGARLNHSDTARPQFQMALLSLTDGRYSGRLSIPFMDPCTTDPSFDFDPENVETLVFYPVFGESGLNRSFILIFAQSVLAALGATSQMGSEMVIRHDDIGAVVSIQWNASATSRIKNIFKWKFWTHPDNKQKPGIKMDGNKMFADSWKDVYMFFRIVNSAAYFPVYVMEGTAHLKKQFEGSVNLIQGRKLLERAFRHYFSVVDRVPEYGSWARIKIGESTKLGKAIRSIVAFPIIFRDNDQSEQINSLYERIAKKFFHEGFIKDEQDIWNMTCNNLMSLIPYIAMCISWGENPVLLRDWLT